MLDILIQNGWVVDGTGAPRYMADVAIEGDRIIDVDRMEGAEAESVIVNGTLVVHDNRHTQVRPGSVLGH